MAASFSTKDMSHFLKFVFSQGEPSYGECQRTFAHLEHHPGQIEDILKGDALTIYLSDFEVYTQRIVSLLMRSNPANTSTQLNPAPKKKAAENKFGQKPKSKQAYSSFTPAGEAVIPVHEAFVKYLLLPLLDAAENNPGTADFTATAEFIELLAAVLHIYLPSAQTTRASLKPLQHMLAAISILPGRHQSGLLERLLASERGGTQLKTLFNSKPLVAKVSSVFLLETYTYRVASMVQKCVVSHGPQIDNILNEWIDIQVLKSALSSFHEVLAELDNLRKNIAVQRQEKVRQNQYNLRVLKRPENENRYGLLRSSPSPEPSSKIVEDELEKIPPPELDQNATAVLRRVCGPSTLSPSSEKALLAIQKVLEDRLTLSVLQRLLDTFPCSACEKHTSFDPEGTSYPTPEIPLPPRATNVVRHIEEIVHHIIAQRNKQKRFTRQLLRKPSSEEASAVKTTCAPPKLKRFETASSDGVNGYGIIGAKVKELSGPWTLVLSSRALKDLQDAQRDGRFYTIRKILDELSSGDWSRRGLTKPHRADGVAAVGNNPFLSACGKNVFPLHKPTFEGDEDDRYQWEVEEWTGTGLDQKVLKLYKAIYSKNHRILWGVEGAWDATVGGWRQVIKIHAVGDHKAMLDVIPSILRTHRTYSSEFIKACKLRETDGSHRYLPALFALSKNGQKITPTGHANASAPLTRQILTREETLGLHEAAVTNKFYTLTTKLVESLLAAHEAGVQPEFAFDMNEQETKIIREKKSVLVLGRSGTGKTTCLVYKLLASYMARRANGAPSQPLLLTKSPILASKISQYLKRLIESQLCEFTNVMEEQLPDDALVECEERWGPASQEANDLFQIQDWPLVCTFDNFCELLERTLEVTDRSTFRSVPSTSEIQLSREQRRVDYEKFKRVYWPKVPERMRKDLCVDLAFAELSGVIKSGKYENDFKPLSREEYVSMSSRMAPTFCDHAEREKVYDIFEFYQRRLKQEGEWDDLDRCRVLRKNLLKDPSLSERVKSVFSEIYVDEVQDLRYSEIGLLLRLMINPHGLHLAGDTAQSISRDSHFRFADVKALFYQNFRGLLSKKGKGNTDLAKPYMFTLNVNYRSHCGILALASAVIELLWKAFPDSIDKLEPEVGQFLGPRPKLFVNFSSEVFGNRLFGICSVALDLSDFGAEQVVLVRDDEARQRLKSEIGAVTLILTILESKGMEFEDVLLYNFFTDCPEAAAGFRAFISEEFDSKRHAVLCAELKGLYVAVTRSRSRLWLIEKNGALVAPLIKAWATDTPEHPALIDAVYPGDKNVPEILKGMRQGNSNNPKDWFNKGREFLEKKLYEPALQCFTKAGDERGQNLCEGYLAERKARDSISRPEEAKSYFRKAAMRFLAADHPLSATRCYVSIRDFSAAANLWVERSHHAKAAGFFEQAGLRKNAAHHYHLAGLKSEAATAYRDGEHFDMLLEYLAEQKEDIDSVLFRKYARLVNILFLRNSTAEKSLQLLAIELLGSPEDKERFLKQYGMSAELVEHYIETKQIEKAIRHFVNCGNYNSAARLISVGIHQYRRSDLHAPICDEVYSWIHTCHLREIIPKLKGFEYVPLQRIEGMLTPGKDIEEIGSVTARRCWRLIRDEVAAWFLQSTDKVRNNSKLKEQNEDWTLTRDLLIAHNGEYLAQAFKPRDLPFEAIMNCAEALKITAKEGAPPSALKRFYMISDIEDMLEMVWIVEPSILLKGGPTVKMPREQANNLLAKTLSNAIAKTVYSWESKVWDELKSAAMCEEFAVRGVCKYGETNCNYVTGHYQLTREDVEQRIKLLMSATELLAHALHFPFFNGLLLSELSSSYRGKVRRWLEMLLAFTTHTSEFLTHPLIRLSSVLGAMSTVQPSEPERAVTSGLEDLLYYRLRTQKDKWWNFSGLLESYNLAESLNCSGFVPMVLSNISWDDVPQAQWSSLNLMHNIFLLRNAIVESDIASAIDYLYYIFMSIQDLSFKDLHFFHAVITLWEKYCCFLIVLASPGEFLIKDSWRKNGIFDSFMPLLAKFECHPPERRELLMADARKGLDMAVTSILTVLARVEAEDKGPNLLKKLFLKRPDAMIHRVIDLVSICLCNMQEGTSPYPLPDSTLLKIMDAWNSWRSYLKLPTLGDRDVFKFMSIFVRAHVNDFDFDIERITVMRRGTNKSSKFRAVKQPWAVKQLYFPTFRDFDRADLFPGVHASNGKRKSARSKHFTTATTLDDEGSATNKNSNTKGYSKAQKASACKIQNFWRKYKPLLLIRRAFLKTPEGRAAAKIADLCHEMRNPINETMEKRRLRLIILRHRGIPVEFTLITAWSRIAEIKAYALSRLNEAGIASSMVEKIDEALQDIEAYETELRDMKNELNLKAVVTQPLEYLETHLLELDEIVKSFRRCVEVVAEVLGMEK